MPQCSDLFGRKGLAALNKLSLSEPDATLLREELDLLALIQTRSGNKKSALLSSTPKRRALFGFKASLGWARSWPRSPRRRSIALSASAARLNCVPMLDWFRGPTPAVEKFTRVICSRVATNGCNGRLSKRLGSRSVARPTSAGYRLHRSRGKNANVAITSIARRMGQISWTLLKERRDFCETFPGRSAVRLTAAA